MVIYIYIQVISTWFTGTAPQVTNYNLTTCSAVLRAAMWDYHRVRRVRRTKETISPTSKPNVWCQPVTTLTEMGTHLLKAMWTEASFFSSWPCWWLVEKGCVRPVKAWNRIILQFYRWNWYNYCTASRILEVAVLSSTPKSSKEAAVKEPTNPKQTKCLTASQSFQTSGYIFKVSCRN